MKKINFKLSSLSILLLSALLVSQPGLAKYRKYPKINKPNDAININCKDVTPTVLKIGVDRFGRKLMIPAVVGTYCNSKSPIFNRPLEKVTEVEKPIYINDMGSDPKSKYKCTGLVFFENDFVKMVGTGCQIVED